MFFSQDISTAQTELGHDVVNLRRELSDDLQDGNEDGGDQGCNNNDNGVVNSAAGSFDSGNNGFCNFREQDKEVCNQRYWLIVLCVGRVQNAYHSIRDIIDILAALRRPN